MKRINKALFGVLLSVTMLITAFGGIAFAADEETPAFTYVYNGTETVITEEDIASVAETMTIIDEGQFAALTDVLEAAGAVTANCSYSASAADLTIYYAADTDLYVYKDGAGYRMAVRGSSKRNWQWVNGVVTINGYDHNYQDCICVNKINDSKTTTAECGAIETHGTWVRDDTGRWFRNNDGTYPRSAWKYLEDEDLCSMNWYYFDSKGYAVTGWKSINKKWYCFDEDCAMITGWAEDNDKWYYLDDNGAMKTGWLQQEDTWYYLNSSGAAVTGWNKIGGKWYFFDDEYSMVTGFFDDNGKIYYADDNGAMKIGWLQQEDTWYYLNSSGAAVTGWNKIGGKWYCFDSKYAMITGWVLDNDKYYYTNDKGAMVTGWYLISDEEGNSDYYYFDASGVMQVNRWIGSYYVGEDGIMLTDCWTPDGYYVDENGKWVKGKVQE